MSDYKSNRYELFLLRHGESQGNAEKYLQGQEEYPLTDLGFKQAKALANYWKTKNIQFDNIITSPQLRARETAEIIANVSGQNIEINPIWKERNYGNLSGKPLNEVRHLLEDPEANQLHHKIGQTGESEWEFFQRGDKAMQSILKKSPGKYLIVSHGGTINMCFRVILGIPPHNNFRSPIFRCGNTAFASLYFYQDSQVWYINSLNERPHWVDKEKEAI